MAALAMPMSMNPDMDGNTEGMNQPGSTEGSMMGSGGGGGGPEFSTGSESITNGVKINIKNSTSGGNMKENGTNMGMGGSNIGMGNTNMGTGGSNIGMDGTNIGMGGSNIGMGGSNIGMNGTNIGMGGTNMGIGNTNMMNNVGDVMSPPDMTMLTNDHMTAPGMDMMNVNTNVMTGGDDIFIAGGDDMIPMGGGMGSTGTGTGTGVDGDTGDENFGGGGNGSDTQPTAGDSTGTGEAASARDNLVRMKRNHSFKSNNYHINELARRILQSIEAALVAHQDGGSCLRKTLCENNSYSRSLSDNGKIWIPVWSLGMSWLSGKLNKEIPPATSMLDSLKASILGLGRASCDVIYQECNLKDEITNRKRRRRRRKRSTS